MFKLRTALVTMAAFSLIATLYIAYSDSLPPIHAQTSPLVWARVDLRESMVTWAQLNDVFMVDQNNAWVVGEVRLPGARYREGRAYKLEWHNDKWSVTESYESRVPLFAVYATSNDKVWAVGTGLVGDDCCTAQNLILHKDANGWHETTDASKDIYYRVIRMVGDGEEGWIGGSKRATNCHEPCFEALLLHYVDGRWQRDTSIMGIRDYIGGIHLVPGGGYAASGTGVYRYDAGTWVREQIPRQPQDCGVIFGSCYGLQDISAVNSDEAWAVGSRSLAGSTQVGRSEELLLRRTNGRWTQIFPQEGIVGAEPPKGYPRFLGVNFNSDGSGFIVGSLGSVDDPDFSFGPYIVSYGLDNLLHYERTPYIAKAELFDVSSVDVTHALAVGAARDVNSNTMNYLLLSYGYGGPEPQPWPTRPPTRTPTVTRTPLPHPPTLTPTPTAVPGSPPTTRVDNRYYEDGVYFENVGHNLRGGFLVYWQQHGGLGQFGYPLTEEFVEISPTDGKPYITQYFERARMEWHPENRPPYDVLLGLLGQTVTAHRRGEAPFKPAQPVAGRIYFPETQHNIAPEFLAYWQSRGGLPVYGFPISEPFNEVSSSDGKTYLVQYFERNRLEYHPELEEQFRVSLGLLGVEVLRLRGWMP